MPRRNINARMQYTKRSKSFQRQIWLKTETGWKAVPEKRGDDKPKQS